MTVTRFVVSPAALGGLAELMPGEKSPLSPLHIPNPPELTPDQHASLFEIGMLDQNGLVEPARLMLAALSEAPSFARIRLNAPTGYLDEAIHFTGDGTQCVGISNTPDGLALSSPGDSESIFSQIKDFTGTSAHKGPTWSVELLPLEMLCLAVLMDLRRQAVLHAIVDQQPVVPLPSDVQAITDTIQSMWGNPQWLTNAIQNAAAIRTPPAADLVQPALAALVEKKQAWHQSGNYYPIPEAIQTADRFLLISTVIHLDAGNSNMQGRYTLLRQSWLQASITEMLHISQVKDQIHLQLVSPAGALEKVHFFLTHYDAVPAPPIEDIELSIAIQAGIGAGKIYPLAEETVIGRSEQASVHILDTRASRRHAVIRKLTQGYQLIDAGSTNGTFLNGELMSRPSWLHDGDLITIGETRIKVIRSGQNFNHVSSERTVFAGEGVKLPSPSQPSPTTPQIEESTPVEPEPVESLPPEEPVFIPSEEPGQPLTTQQEQAAPSPEALDEAEALREQPEDKLPVPEQNLASPQEPILSEAAEPEESHLETSAAFAGPEVLDDRNIPSQNAGVEMPSESPETLVCPKCGSEINPGARFCGNCGNQLQE